MGVPVSNSNCNEKLYFSYNEGSMDKVMKIENGQATHKQRWLMSATPHFTKI